jgi:uncharacterized protein (DUF58 family)
MGPRVRPSLGHRGDLEKGSSAEGRLNTLTRRGFGYLGIAYAFIFLSLAFRTPWLTLFTLPIAILLFFSVTLPKSNLVPIKVARQMKPTRSIAGEDVNVILTVTNSSSHLIHSFQIEDTVPEGLKLSGGTNRLILSLRGGEAARFEYQISKLKRGSYWIGPTLVRFSDSLGIRTLDLQLSNADELIVIPQVEKLGVVDLRGRRFGPWPGLVPSKRIGIGTEFFEIAPYVAGDDLRRVNWKASARAGMLVTNAFEGEQVIDVLILLDCSDDVRSALFDYDALEFQVSFAASLCSQLIMQGNRVGLSVYGAVRTWVSPSFGKRHLLRLLDSLAFVRPGPATLPIKYVTESVVSAILPSRSLVVLISPMISEDVVDMLEGVAARGYAINCFTPSVGPKLLGKSDVSRIARRIFSAERQLRIIRARKTAKVVQLSPDLPVRRLLR